MMSHAPILPLLLPALAGAAALCCSGRAARRAVAFAGLGAAFLSALALMVAVAGGERLVYRLGDWPAPFGIVLVADRLSALMVALAAGVTGLAFAHAVLTGRDGAPDEDREAPPHRPGGGTSPHPPGGGTPPDSRGEETPPDPPGRAIGAVPAGDGVEDRPHGGRRHFHALVLLQLFGLNGAFLTGDVFNLFVFFEVMLIASYGLIVQGGGAARLRAALGYVVANLAASALFLVALGTLYAVTGTLNMADLALRAAAMPDADAAFLRVGVALLFLTFGFKAALVPMQAWLPSAYAAAPGAVAAILTLLTKVGAYALLRMGALLEPSGLSAAMAPWLAAAGGATLGLGALGLLGAGTLPRMAGFAVIASMGTLALTLSALSPAGMAAAVFYLVQATVAAALLFLLVEGLMARRGADLAPGPRLPAQGAAGWLFLGTALVLAGLPPLSGFPAKLLILNATAGSPAVWAVILCATLVAVIGYARAGSLVFWNGTAAAARPPLPRGLMVPGAMMAVLILLTLAAGPVERMAAAVAAQLTDVPGYVRAVLEPAP